mmetsp:Transcript_8386/g.24930  ORF Transcript_8386/g.24930 Transcript_8386/m.24930 type:complete len:244 (+) Transcript_8386:6204-6935(+)
MSLTVTVKVKSVCASLSKTRAVRTWPLPLMTKAPLPPLIEKTCSSTPFAPISASVVTTLKRTVPGVVVSANEKIVDPRFTITGGLSFTSVTVITIVVKLADANEVNPSSAPRSITRPLSVYCDVFSRSSVLWVNMYPAMGSIENFPASFPPIIEKRTVPESPESASVAAIRLHTVCVEMSSGSVHDSSSCDCKGWLSLKSVTVMRTVASECSGTGTPKSWARTVRSYDETRSRSSGREDTVLR